MNARHGTRLATLLAALALGTAGCLERKERLEVHADGSVEVALAFKGDAGEFAPERADALPVSAPWTVSDREVPKADGGSDHLREARASFARVADLPGSFGAAGDPAPLRWSTSLATERLADGSTRWVLERRYGKRDLAWREHLFRRAFPDALRKELETAGSEARGAPLPEPLLRKAVDALLRFERDKTAAFLEQALRETGGASTPATLEARAAFDRSFQETWRPETILGSFASPGERAKLEERYRVETARAAGRAGASALGVSGDERLPLEARLERAFAERRRVLEVTEALRAHAFEVRVAMPGRITLSSADAVEDEGRTAVFRFGGEDLMDDERVLRVVAEARP